MLDNIDLMDIDLYDLGTTLSSEEIITLDELLLFESWLNTELLNKDIKWDPKDKASRIKFLEAVIDGDIPVPKTSDVLIKVYENLDVIDTRLGLCNIAVELLQDGIITGVEFRLFMEYLWEHRPLIAIWRSAGVYDFFWTPGKRRPRERWLRRNIKKCKKRGD